MVCSMPGLLLEERTVQGELKNVVSSPVQVE